MLEQRGAVLGLSNLSPQYSRPPGTSECDLLWKDSACKCNQLR